MKRGKRYRGNCYNKTQNITGENGLCKRANNNLTGYFTVTRYYLKRTVRLLFKSPDHKI